MLEAFPYRACFSSLEDEVVFFQIPYQIIGLLSVGSVF